MPRVVVAAGRKGSAYGVSDMSLSLHLPAADLKAGRFDRLDVTFR
jgi:hypothetical protein